MLNEIILLFSSPEHYVLICTIAETAMSWLAIVFPFRLHFYKETEKKKHCSRDCLYDCMLVNSVLRKDNDILQCINVCPELVLLLLCLKLCTGMRKWKKDDSFLTHQDKWNSLTNFPNKRPNNYIMTQHNVVYVQSNGEIIFQQAFRWNTAGNY